MNENGFKCNTEQKMPVKLPPKVSVEKEHDENEFSGFKPQGFQVTPMKSSCMRFRANISG